MLPTRRGAHQQTGAALLLFTLLLSLASSVVLMRMFAPARQSLLNDQQTFRTLQSAREALIGYALRNGRFPRPAVSAIDGHETTQPCIDQRACSGFIPWVTLGIERTDGWGTLLRYSATRSFVENKIQIGQSIADKQLLSRTPDGRTYHNVGAAKCDLSTECSPVVVFSSGKSGPGTSTLGIPRNSAGGTDERANSDGVTTFYRRPQSASDDVAGGKIDDLVIAISLRDLYLPLNRTATER